MSEGHSANIEYCDMCDEETGRAGIADDSLYTDDGGPYCEACYERLCRASTWMLSALKSIVEAVEAELPWPNSAHTQGTWLDTMPFLDEPITDAIAAIKKAEGKS